MVYGEKPRTDWASESRQKLANLRDKIERTAVAIKETQGHPSRAGNIDVQIAIFFADYIEWELEHPELMKDALLGNETYSDNGFVPALERPRTVDPTDPERRYRSHIETELNDSTTILDQALARLEINADWPSSIDIRWSEMNYRDGYFRVHGRPVFTAGFNMLERDLVDLSQFPEWAAKTESLTRSFLLAMKSIGVGILGIGVSVPSLVTKDGGVNAKQIGELVARCRRYEQMGFRIDVLFSWNGEPATLERLWPGITEYYGNSIALDIDHPGTKILISRVMTELMPALREVPAIVSWDMANEPFFDLDMWSPHSLEQYRNWLAGQYDTIEELNRLWKTDHTAFDQIGAPREKGRGACAPGEWFDRITFHNRRVSAFFELVQSEVRRCIPDAVIHLKAQDNSSLGPRPEAVMEGIDRESLTPFSDLHGVDTRPLPVTEPRMAAQAVKGNSVLEYDGSPYGFHWLGQSFLYDYLTSLEPNRPVVDFEYHAFSINAIRLPNIPQSHPRAALWMAHLHGLIGNMTWYWHRRYGPHPFPADYFKMWLYGSISTQPLIAAEYFQTMLNLNSFAEEVEALATDSWRPVRLLVSMPSYIADQTHINALHRSYEATCFHGFRVGFITDAMLANDTMPADCRIIVVPDVAYIDEPELRGLERAERAGARVVRFGDTKPTFDAHGQTHRDESVAFLEDVPVYEHSSAQRLSLEFRELFSPLTRAIPTRVDILGDTGSFGVMHRQVEVNGSRIILIVNLRDKAVEVALCSSEQRTIDGYDMLNREAVNGASIELPYEGVRLIQVRS